MRRLFFILLLFISFNSHSQISSSEISGHIKDRNGKKVVHAKVTIFYKSKGITYGTYTDDNGIYRFHFVETGGPYKLKVEHQLFLPYEKGDLELELGNNSLDILIEEKKNFD